MPTKLFLHQNFPNPFNPSTKISFSLPKPDFVKIKIHDILGKEIVNLAEGSYEAGKHDIIFNASHSELSRRMASGIYFYNLTTSNGSITKKMLLLK